MKISFKIKLLPALIAAFFYFTNGNAQCSTTNPAGCSCPVTGQVNCTLLPDIIAGKGTLNAANGWSEFSQSDATPDKGMLRIDVSTPNIGWGPMECHSTDNYICGGDTLYNFFPAPDFLCPDGSYPKRLIKQRIYEKAGNTLQFTDRDAGWMQYHPSHGHIHIEGWGLYTLRLKDASITDTLQWPVVNSGIKASFCLYDLADCNNFPGDCRDASGTILNNTDFPNFGFNGDYGGDCGQVKQGISVGYLDYYHRFLDESFVKIPYEACNGTYYAMVQIDADNHFIEIDKSNNWLAAETVLTKQRTTNSRPYSYIFSKKGNSICQGGTLQLEASGANSYLWNNGATTQKININAPGRYWVEATTSCGATTSDTLDVIAASPNSVPAVTTDDNVCAGERADLYASGNAYWYDALVDGNLVFIGNNFQTGNLLNTTTFYVVDQAPAASGATGNLGPVSASFSGDGNYLGSRGEYLIFNAFLPFKLKKVRVDAASNGSRIIQLRDQYGHVLLEKTIALVIGVQDITLDFFIPSGLNYQLGLSPVSPIATLHTSTTTNSNIGFPFDLKSVGNIVGSSSGDVSFPFFYNWEVEVTSEACSNGNRKAVTAHVAAGPAIVISGLQAVYSHNAPGVQLTATPAGGVFSGNGVINGYFYPKVAGVGTHTITYTYNNGSCVVQDTKTVDVVLDETLLKDDFAVQVWDQPGAHPLLWIVSRNNAPVEISIFNSIGQLINKMDKMVFTGTNSFPMDFSNLAKGLYFIKVRNAANGKMKSIKVVI
ncbi:MAG: T9SS type A sorting domain-containing protein [Chitinophagaceae bacterium]